MLVGGDLGFPNLVLVVVLFGSVIGFVVRRKWRLAVARREEIKMLLVLAAEEAARAELEATTGYGATGASVSWQLEYQCAVCYCATTTRCARCKAVRYCSGKCQIVHWRQGHKEECRPFTTINQITDLGVGSSPKLFKQEEYENYDNSFETEGRQCAKPIETFPEESAFSDSSHSKFLHKKDDIEVECLADGVGINSIPKFTTRSVYEGYSASTTHSESSVDASVSNSNDSDRSDGLQSTDVAPDKFETNCANTDQNWTPFLEHPTSVNSVNSFTRLGKFNQIKPSGSDGETQCGSSSSSGWSVDGSDESSFSETSRPYSGFWEGTIASRRFRTDVVEDSAQSSLCQADDGNMPKSQSSLSLSFDLAKNTVPPMDLQGPNTKTVILDDAGPITLTIKKSIDESALSEELSGDGLKSRRSSSSSFETCNHMDVDTCSDSRIFKSGEHRFSSSNASFAHSASSAGGHLISNEAKKVSSLLFVSPERLNHVVNDMTTSTSYTLKSGEVGSLLSKASDAHLSSSTRRHSAQCAKSVKVDDGVHGVGACSSQFAGYSQNARNGLQKSACKVVDQLESSKLSQHYLLGAGNEIAGRFSFKGLFPYDLFVNLYNWNKVELHPCGLTNCGNSCYANAVLQCLTFTPPLTAYLLQGLHSKSCEKKEWCFTCEFESLVLKAKEGNSPVSPNRILSQIHNIGSHLGNGREEDAHEFLRYAIDTMQSVCLKEARANVSSSLEEETTLIGLTFGGCLRSKIKCMKCGGKSERHERMMDLTVEIGGDIGTLEDALRQFTGTEILDGENKYQCSRCKSYEKAKKRLTVLEAPNVLTIALKRFQSGKFGKLNKSIRFPEILDLAPYMSGTSDKSPIYRLFGVVVHLDIMNAAFSGHYVCYIKNIQNKWFKIDDSTVEAVELEFVMAKGAYMLLYARCSPRAPRLIRNSIIPRDPRKLKNPTSKSRSHSKGPWDVCVSITEHLNGPSKMERFYPDHSSFQPIRPVSDEDSSSDNASSLFSEAGSCSTESSTRKSTSTDDYFDHIFGDFGCNLNSPGRNSSDSDTSSSSSSPSPSPFYLRHSPLANSDCYASGCRETSGSQIDYAESAVDGRGLQARLPSRSGIVESLEGKESAPFLYSDMTKQCRKEVSSNISCRETDSDRLGWLNPFDNVKSGLSFRRSAMERMD